MMFALATDSQTRTSFINYLSRTSSVIFVVVMIILGVINYSLGKAYASDKKYQPETKRNINFLEDCIKGSIFVIMIIFVTSFVQ